MRLRTFLILSIGLNMVLFACWYHSSRPAYSTVDTASPETNEPSRPRVNVVMRTQTFNFTWHEVESADYVTYIRNLRAIGCPEQTIRDIIVADVNQLYSHRRATEVVAADQQWWRSEPDRNLIKEAVEKMKSLDAERKSLLTKLLGPGWDADLNAILPAVRTIISLTGLVLGDLPAATKQGVFNIAMKMQEKIDAYQDAQRQQGKPVDPLEMLRIREASRSELAALLDPSQMEEFLLRYSQTAKDLRGELRGLNPTPEEFRALFRARDPLDSQTDLYYTGTDAEALKRREELQKKRDEAIQTALGPERYAEYKLNLDPTFQQARSTVEGLGLEADKVLPMYEINRLTSSEMDRIRADDSLTLEEKVDALAEAQVDQQKSIQQILGDKAFERWLIGGKLRK